MELEQMLNVQNLGSTGQLSATGSVAGAVIGSFFGAPAVGAAVGSAVGTVASAFIPEYKHVRGSVSGINFANLKLKPYMITLVEPDDETAKNISDFYCYYGCKTSRQESLNISNYMYNDHAFVQGDLQYNESIPLDKFKQINDIFKNGVHILN